MSRRGTGEWRYLTLTIVVTMLYAVVAAMLYANKDFVEHGPLTYPSAGTADPPAGVLTSDEALERCYPYRSTPTFRYIVVTGEVLGEWHHACYEILARTSDVQVIVVDARGSRVTDAAILKAAGVWPRVAIVSTSRGLVIGFVAVVAVFALGWFYYRKPRPGPPLRPDAGRSSWWERRGAAWLLVLLPVVSWISFVATSRISAARKVRNLFQATLIVVWLLTGYQLLGSVVIRDPWGLSVFGFVGAALLASVLGGSRWLAPAEFDYPDRKGELGFGNDAMQTRQPPPDRQSSIAISESMPRIPGLTDFAIRQFAAAARSRLTVGTMLHGTAIAIAAFMFIILTIVGGVALSMSWAPEALGLVVILWFYVLFFVVPGVGTALLASPLIFGWRNPARILLLRPFNRPDHSRPLRKLVRREVAGYGHTYSLADVAIRVRWYVAVPVLLGQLGLLSFRLRRVKGPSGLRRLARVVGYRRRRNLNWTVSRSKVFAVRCTDQVWQQAVGQMVRTCDAVLIDVTDLTGNLVWELELLRRLRRLDDCIFLSLRGTETRAAAAVEHQLGFAVRLQGFDWAGRLVAPGDFRHALAVILFRDTSTAPSQPNAGS